jgi:hypothetical protein
MVICVSFRNAHVVIKMKVIEGKTMEKIPNSNGKNPPLKNKVIGRWN